MWFPPIRSQIRRVAPQLGHGDCDILNLLERLKLGRNLLRIACLDCAEQQYDFGDEFSVAVL